MNGSNTRNSAFGPITTIAGVSVMWGDDGLPVGWPWEHGVPSIGLDVLMWAEEMLAQPDGDNLGDPWKWTDWQARFVAWWYCVNPAPNAKGKIDWLFRDGQLVLAKGTGKSPLAAAFACVELLGPAKFSHFDKDGDARGKAYASPLVQLAAVSEAQTENTMKLVASMLRNGKIYTIMGDQLDIGLKKIRVPNGELIASSASADSAEGKRTTAAVLDETHRWNKSNKGIELYETIIGNLTKMGGRPLETTNAWTPGRNSVAESNGATAASMRAGKTRLTTFLQYMRSAPADTKIRDEASLRAALEYVYDGCPWAPIDAYIARIYTSNFPVERARRMFLNQIIAAEDAFFDPLILQQLRSQDTIQPGDEIVLGFDGGKNDDATALVACRVSDRFFQPIGIWEKPADWDDDDNGPWQVDQPLVDAAVRNTFAKYKVVAFFSDVEHWSSYVDQWSLDFRNVLAIKAAPHSYVAWDMRGRLKESTEHGERIYAAVENHLVRFNSAQLVRPNVSDDVFWTHLVNVRRRFNNFGDYSFGKESRESKKKVDGYAAMLLADMARAKYLETGKQRKGGSFAL